VTRAELLERHPELAEVGGGEWLEEGFEVNSIAKGL